MFDSTRIGGCEFTLENDALRLYSHSFGQSTGFSTRMSSEDALQLLEWLSQHHEDISRAVHAHAKQHQQATENLHSLW